MISVNNGIRHCQICCGNVFANAQFVYCCVIGVLIAHKACGNRIIKELAGVIYKGRYKLIDRGMPNETSEL